MDNLIDYDIMVSNTDFIRYVYSSWWKCFSKTQAENLVSQVVAENDKSQRGLSTSLYMSLRAASFTILRSSWLLSKLRRMKSSSSSYCSCSTPSLSSGYSFILQSISESKDMLFNSEFSVSSESSSITIFSLMCLLKSLMHSTGASPQFAYF